MTKNMPPRGLMIAALVAMAAASAADGWLLKVPYEAGAQYVWKVTENVDVGGKDRTITMNQNLTIDSKADANFKGKFGWTNVSVDGMEIKELSMAWNVSLSLAGSILTSGDNVAYSRMLTPLVFFIYPGKEVKVGDKWTTKFKPGEGGKEAHDAKVMTCDFEAVAEEKVGNIDALRIKALLTEDGPMKGNNVYWIGKDGKVLRFEADLRHWTARLGSRTGELDAKFKGELVSGK